MAITAPAIRARDEVMRAAPLSGTVVALPVAAAEVSAAVDSDPNKAY